MAENGSSCPSLATWLRSSLTSKQDRKTIDDGSPSVVYGFGALLLTQTLAQKPYQHSASKWPSKKRGRFGLWISEQKYLCLLKRAPGARRLRPRPSSHYAGPI